LVRQRLLVLFLVRVLWRSSVNLDAVISALMWAVLALFAVVFFVQRLVWRLRGKIGFYPSGAGFGNALQRLQVIAQPEVRYVIREKEDEESDGEDTGDPDHPIDPRTHLHRQARRIRRGDEVDRITALVER
jgi:hypothetical protein